MSKLFSTQEKLNIAKLAIDKFCGQAAENYDDQLNELEKLEQCYNESKHYSITDFCIKLSKIPVQHLRFMAAIGWLKPFTYKPTKCSKGFYKTTTRSGQDKYFVTVNAYINLLLIECEIKDMYV